MSIKSVLTSCYAGNKRRILLGLVVVCIILMVCMFWTEEGVYRSDYVGYLAGGCRGYIYLRDGNVSMFNVYDNTILTGFQKLGTYERSWGVIYATFKIHDIKYMVRGIITPVGIWWVSCRDLMDLFTWRLFTNKQFNFHLIPKECQ